MSQPRHPMALNGILSLKKRSTEGSLPELGGEPIVNRRHPGGCYVPRKKCQINFPIYLYTLNLIRPNARSMFVTRTYSDLTFPSIVNVNLNVNVNVNVTVFCLPTEHQEFTRTRLKCPCIPGSKGNLVFEETGKPEYLEKNLSEKSREPTTKSTHI